MGSDRASTSSGVLAVTRDSPVIVAVDNLPANSKGRRKGIHEKGGERLENGVSQVADEESGITAVDAETGGIEKRKLKGGKRKKGRRRRTKQGEAALTVCDGNDEKELAGLVSVEERQDAAVVLVDEFIVEEEGKNHLAGVDNVIKEFLAEERKKSSAGGNDEERKVAPFSLRRRDGVSRKRQRPSSSAGVSVGEGGDIIAAKMTAPRGSSNRVVPLAQPYNLSMPVGVTTVIPSAANLDAVTLASLPKAKSSRRRRSRSNRQANRLVVAAVAGAAEGPPPPPPVSVYTAIPADAVSDAQSLSRAISSKAYDTKNTVGNSVDPSSRNVFAREIPSVQLKPSASVFSVNKFSKRGYVYYR